MIHYITTNGIGNPWVAAELRGMLEAGVPVRLHSMRNPGKHFFVSEWAHLLNAETSYLYPIHPLSLLRTIAVAPIVFRKRLISCLLNSVFGSRESVRARLASVVHVLVAAHWSLTMRKQPVDLIHSQWIHSCGTIGMYGAWLLGVPFSFTGHAVDLFRDRCALEDKIQRAAFIVCISQFHRRFYMEHGAQDSKLITVHCGIDLRQFTFRERDATPVIPHIVSLGRLVDKKGFEYLIDACHVLRGRGITFQCTIGGDGPLTQALRQRVRELDLDSFVHVSGKSVLQEDLHDFLQAGDMYVQPCVWSSDNDVDGTPRTLMEAMACGVPSVSTRLAGIPDIIQDGVSGLLVEPNNVVDLANAIQRIINEPGLATTLSKGGRAHIEREFQLPDCLAALEAKFRSFVQNGESDPYKAITGQADFLRAASTR